MGFIQKMHTFPIERTMHKHYFQSEFTLRPVLDLKVSLFDIEFHFLPHSIILDEVIRQKMMSWVDTWMKMYI